MLTESDAVALAADQLLPAWARERAKLDRIDRWARWDHDEPHKPKKATPEYRELGARAQAPWGALIVTSVAQTLYAEGYRRPDNPDDGQGWEIWQANGFDGRQIALHRSALTYGLAYATALPALSPFDGTPMPKLRGVSAREMLAVYDDPADDEWPLYALQVRRSGGQYRLVLFDDTHVFRLSIENIGDKPTIDSVEQHGAGVCPVVRYANRMDLEGRAVGEVEPYIPLLGRIDQTAFDRLVVQRFASWIVRTIAGMDLSATAEELKATIEQLQQRLMVNDILVAKDPETKFGSLPATPLDGFIKAEERDLTDLAAVSQTPAFELLGQMVNMSAEALAAAKSSQTAKGDECKHTFGESHEQLIRLACHLRGDAEGAADFKAQIRWADTSIRSLAQAVDALGKMAQMLGFPPELLWAKVPGITQTDVDEAKARVDEGGGLEALMRELAAGQTSDPDVAPPESDPAVVKAKADAMGVLIRSGVSPESAAAHVGLTGVRFTGAVPVSLRLPESDAADLEA